MPLPHPRTARPRTPRETWEAITHGTSEVGGSEDSLPIATSFGWARGPGSFVQDRLKSSAFGKWRSSSSLIPSIG